MWKNYSKSYFINNRTPFDWRRYRSHLNCSNTLACKQRAQDLQIATERREQDSHVADNLQQDLVLAAYIEQMSELMLTPNFTIDSPLVVNMCRAKTLLAIRQLDSKRKTHLIKFLYDAGMFNNINHI